MPDESKTPQECISDALDLMVKVGWVRQHARNVTGNCTRLDREPVPDYSVMTAVSVVYFTLSILALSVTEVEHRQAMASLTYPAVPLRS